MKPLNVSLDSRIACAALLAVIGVMLILWQPWQGKTSRTITVTGQATVDAVPDNLQFAPSYTASGANSSEAVQKVTALGNAVVVKLKSLGVKNSQIATYVSSNGSIQPLSDNASGQSLPMPPIRYDNLSATYTITITVADQSLAQKVADYLATTSASGTVTPQASFSPAASARLRNQARSKAVDDARATAQAEAAQLGVKAGKVISISESPDIGLVRPLTGQPTPNAGTTSGGPIVAPGSQSLSVQLAVVFAID